MYIVGSSVLKLSNCNDIDYINIIKGKNDIKYTFIDDKNIKHDIFNITIAQLIEKLNFKNSDFINLQLYQYDYRLIGDNFPIYFNILDHKRQIIQILKKLKITIYIVLIHIHTKAIINLNELDII